MINESEISGTDFALGIAEHAVELMQFLESIRKPNIDLKFEEYKHNIDHFNYEILRIIAKLPIKVLGTLLHEAVITRSLDPDSTVFVSKTKIDIYLNQKGTIQ